MPQAGALDPRDRFYGRFTTPTGAFDADGFIQRATLFEEVVVNSPGQLTGLIALFGVDGFLEILESGLVRFLSSSHMIGWADYVRHGFGQGRGLPLMSWFMEVVYVSSPSPTQRFERDATKAMTSRGVASVDQGRVLSALRADIGAHAQLVLDSLLDGVEGKLGREVVRESVQLVVSESSAGVFAVDTNLADVLGASPAAVHELIGPALASYLGTHLQLDVLAQLSAVGEMRAIDAVVMERRSNLLARLVVDRRLEEFLRVLEVGEVPGLNEGDRIDAAQFLRMRQHADCRAFRDWLRQAGRLNDAELKDAVSGWRARLAVVATGPKGRILRWLASTGLGIAAAPAGVALSAADSFLVHKLLAQPGPAVFVERHYRPLVTRAKESRGGRRSADS